MWIERIKENKELWDLFTRKEEYNPLLLDQYQRFPYYLSCNRDILKPKVSEILIENGFDFEYPEGKKFAVCLTHDIDSVYFSKSEIIFMAIKLLKEHKIRNLKVLFSKINKRWNPLWNFKDIMDSEEKYNAKSSFYFLTLDKEDSDFNFEIEDLEHENRNY